MLRSKLASAIALFALSPESANALQREEALIGDAPMSLQHLSGLHPEPAELSGNVTNAAGSWAARNSESGQKGSASWRPANTGRSANVSARSFPAQTAPSSASQLGLPSGLNNSSLSNLGNEVSRRYAGPALELMKKAVKTVQADDHWAVTQLQKASQTFKQAQATQSKMDATAKAAADTEAELTDTKAAALRSLQSAKETSVAAANADLTAELGMSEGSPPTLKRDVHDAEDAVRHAQVNLEAVSSKLAAAETSSAAAQEAASQAEQRTREAQKALEAAKGVATKAAMTRAKIEEKVALKADTIAELAETFAAASKAKADAMKDFKIAKQALIDAAHSVVAFKQVHASPATFGPASRPPNATNTK